MSESTMSVSSAASGPEGIGLTKPTLRGVSHEAAFYAALGAGIVMISLARTLRTGLALGVFALSLTTMFGISALYHRPTWGPEARKLMRKLDHCGIFLLIAGTYTPVCLLVLPEAIGLYLLKAVWLGAGAGILQSIFWVHAPKPVTAGICIALGWFVVKDFGVLWQHLGSTGCALLFLGGLFYTAGAIAYGSRRPNPVPGVFGYHEVFHALVVAAAISHYAMILRVARGL